MRNIFIVFVCAALFGCATASMSHQGYLQTTGQIKIGMSASDVLSIMDKNNYVVASVNEITTRYASKTYGQQSIYVQFKDGKVVSFN